MLREVYDTIFGIIFDEMPKNAEGKPTVFDLPVEGWYFGERTILSETPAILLQANSVAPKEVSFGTRENTYDITVSCWDRSDRTDNTEKRVLEFTRLIHEIILKHRIMWSVVRCPICLQGTLSPIHFLIEHSSYYTPSLDYKTLDNYIQEALSNFIAIWNTSHSTSSIAPTATIPDSGLVTEAFYNFWNDVATDSVPISGDFTADVKSRILVYQANLVRPIRIFYDIFASSIKPVSQNNENQLFRGGEFSLSMKELYKIQEFGPDNVPTGSWGYNP